MDRVTIEWRPELAGNPRLLNHNSRRRMLPYEQDSTSIPALMHIDFQAKNLLFAIVRSSEVEWCSVRLVIETD